MTPTSKVVLSDTARADALALTELALIEDLGSSDLEIARDCTTRSMVADGVDAEARIVSRERGVICGLQICDAILDRFAPGIRLSEVINDGDDVAIGTTVAVLTGEAQQILMMERTCLNILCRLSGVSTLTQQFVKQTEGTSAEIFDTRKTTPGWRRLEKFAVVCGGGRNHRMGLYDAVMIKDNHLAMYGNHIGNHNLSVAQAIELAKTWVADHHLELPHGSETIVQVEVDTLEQLALALPADPDIVLLDNMDTDQLRRAVTMREAVNPKVELEASGGVNLGTVAGIAQSGVERISVGAITHSAINFDLGLDWRLLK